MRRWLIRLGVLVALTVGVLALRWTVFAPQPVSVRVARAERGRVVATVTNSRAGTVRARRRATLSTETGGRVVEIPHREGEVVEKGAVLLRLDDSSQRARVLFARRTLEAAQAQLREAQLRAARAQREVERNRKLAQRGIITDDQLDQFESERLVALATIEAAEARVAQTRAELALTEAELQKTVLLAPFGGVLADVDVDVGEWITPSPPAMPIPAVIDLIDLSSIYVSAPMDEVDSAVIRPGLPVRVTLDPYPGKGFDGVVARVAAFVLDVEAQNRTVEIEVDLADPELASRLLPGTSADVEVITDVREGVLRIPTPALIEGDRVLVVEDGVLVPKPVEVGIKNWDLTEVRSGLEAGDLVVTSLGRAEVAPGAEVVIEEEGLGPSSPRSAASTSSRAVDPATTATTTSPATSPTTPATSPAGGAR